MRYLLTIMIISTLCSCKKDKEDKPAPTPPTVTKIETSSEVVNGVAHPKFTITLNVPDTAVVGNFLVFTKNATSIPCGLLKPKSGTYVVVDLYNPYPATGDRKTYVSAFIMSDNTAIYNSAFDAN